MKGKEPVVVILMGGKSSRMGRDKAFVEWKGKSLLQRAVEIVEKLTSNIYLSVNLEQYEKLKSTYRCIPDKYSEKGPLGGVLSALEYLQNDILVVAVDMPSLNLTSLQNLMNQGSIMQSLLAFKDNSGFWQPLPSYWPQRSVHVLKQAIDTNDYSLNSILKVHGQAINTPLDTGTFLNLNTPEDLD